MSEHLATTNSVEVRFKPEEGLDANFNALARALKSSEVVATSLNGTALKELLPQIASQYFTSGETDGPKIKEIGLGVKMVDDQGGKRPNVDLKAKVEIPPFGELDVNLKMKIRDSDEKGVIASNDVEIGVKKEFIPITQSILEGLPLYGAQIRQGLEQITGNNISDSLRAYLRQKLQEEKIDQEDLRYTFGFDPDGSLKISIFNPRLPATQLADKPTDSTATTTPLSVDVSEPTTSTPLSTSLEPLRAQVSQVAEGSESRWKLALREKLAEEKEAVDGYAASEDWDAYGRHNSVVERIEKLLASDSPPPADIIKELGISFDEQLATTTKPPSEFIVPKRVVSMSSIKQLSEVKKDTEKNMDEAALNNEWEKYERLEKLRSSIKKCIEERKSPSPNLALNIIATNILYSRSQENPALQGGDELSSGVSFLLRETSSLERGGRHKRNGYTIDWNKAEELLGKYDETSSDKLEESEINWLKELVRLRKERNALSTAPKKFASANEEFRKLIIAGPNGLKQKQSGATASEIVDSDTVASQATPGTNVGSWTRNKGDGIDNALLSVPTTAPTSILSVAGEKIKEEKELTPEQRLKLDLDKARANLEEAKQELDDFEKGAFPKEGGKTKFNLPTIRTKGRESNEERRRKYEKRVETANEDLKKTLQELVGASKTPNKENEEEITEKRMWKEIQELQEKKGGAKKEHTEKPHDYVTNDNLFVATRDLEDQLVQYNEFISAKTSFTQEEFREKHPEEYEDYKSLNEQLADVYEQIRKSQVQTGTSVDQEAELVERYRDLVSRKRRLYFKLLRLKELGK